MQIILAGRPFRVDVFARPIVRDGQPCAGWFDPDGGAILISDQVPRGERARVLRHEAWHAWAHAHGLPEQPDPETLADAVAGFAEAFPGALAAAGGELALELLQPVAGQCGQRGGARMAAAKVECPNSATAEAPAVGRGAWTCSSNMAQTRWPSGNAACCGPIPDIHRAR